MKWIKIPSILILVLTMSLSARTDLGNNFWLEDNGVTVTCDGASNDTNSTTEHSNGKPYTKISNEYDLIANGGAVDAENACTSGVTNMSGWFSYRSTFNKDISHWDTSSVTNMGSVFQGATLFNQPIGYWNMSNVTTIAYIFLDATAFNQDIGDWNTSSVTGMSRAFFNAAAFNQDISKWDVSKVTNMSSMFTNVTLSTINYDKLLVEWNKLTLQSSVTFHGGNSKYTPNSAPSTARANMISSDSWIITDGGEVENTIPSFDAGATNSLTVTEDSGATDIKDKLIVTDADSGNTLTWSQSSAPTHGTLGFNGAIASTGTSVTSGGTITYTPTANYNGTDSFVVQVSDGIDTDTIIVTVTVTAITTSGVVFATQVEAIDEHGNLDTDYVGAVTLTKNGAGTLGGTVTKTAVSGVIVYDDLKYTAIADNETYTLTATSGSVSGTSANIISTGGGSTGGSTSTPKPPSIVVPFDEDGKKSETTAEFNNAVGADIDKTEDTTTATMEIKDKKVEVAVHESGTMKGKVESEDEDGNLIISSVEIALIKSKTSVDAKGNINTTVHTKNGATIKTILGIDGSVRHEVKSKDGVTVAVSAIAGSKVEVDKEGNVKTTSTVEKDGFLHKAVVTTDTKGKTTTKFVIIDKETGVEISSKTGTVPYQAGSKATIKNENGRITIEVEVKMTQDIRFK